MLEVWGDTVDPVHLAWSVVIGATLGLAAFLGADRLLAALTTPAIARTDAMLCGLLGCVAAGAVCARLFQPKRELIEDGRIASWREEALARLAAEAGTAREAGTAGSIAPPPPATLAELEALGLAELFDPRPAADAGLRAGPGAGPAAAASQASGNGG